MRALALLLMVLSSCVHAPAFPVNQREVGATLRLTIVTELSTSVATVGSFAGSCSSVAIGEHKILTAAHCVRVDVPDELVALGITGRISDIIVSDYAGNDICTAEIIKVDPKLDLALLRSECALPWTAKVATYQPAPGTPVQLTGYPHGYPAVVMVDGYLTTTVQGEGPASGKQVCSAPIIGGNSGGPVWVNGEIVGIVSMGSTEFHHAGMVVTETSIREFLFR